LTEPDPRDDLAALDVQRKLLILAREIGAKLELKDVKTENLIPKPLRKVGLKQFLDKLKEYDEYFDFLLKKARRENKFLRYIGETSINGAQAALHAVPPDSPFAHLKENDNVFVFHTKHYNKRPLVIQGPGAGAEVAAAGILANIFEV